ncbi:MAG: EpsI family protein [Gemmataceae bacterium]|nr:EpsI family protein [Gemmataceae bacterium]MCI0743360.1 EpsI family protein [Gemmataceae bacterium]
MNRFLPVLVVAVLIVLSGVVHGLWTDRWIVSQELENAAKRLESFVPELDDWQSQPLELDPRQKEQGGVISCMLRRFENRRNGKAIVVLMTCGRPGPMSVHTPEVCYVGAGYRMADPTRRKLASNGSPKATEFWTAKFTKGHGVEDTRLRLYWCWRGAERWDAPENPRVAFAGQPFLYKLYVIQDLVSSDEAMDDEHCREFIARLVPELERGLAKQH